jgi:hypothetical protein
VLETEYFCIVRKVDSAFRQHVLNQSPQGREQRQRTCS